MACVYVLGGCSAADECVAMTCSGGFRLTIETADGAPFPEGDYQLQVSLDEGDPLTLGCTVVQPVPDDPGTCDKGVAGTYSVDVALGVRNNEGFFIQAMSGEGDADRGGPATIDVTLSKQGMPDVSSHFEPEYQNTDWGVGCWRCESASDVLLISSS